MIVSKGHIRVNRQWEAFQLKAKNLLLTRREEANDPNPIFAAVLVQQLTIPFVHVHVFLQVFKHNHGKLAFVQIGQQWQAFARYFYFKLYSAGLQNFDYLLSNLAVLGLYEDKDLWI